MANDEIASGRPVILNGRKIKLRRSELRITQAELAERTQLEMSMISRIEAGRVRPKPQTLRRLSRELGFGVDALWKDEASSEAPPPPSDASFAELLRAAMRIGLGKSDHNRHFIVDDGSPWLVKQLAMAVPVSESALSSWRTGRVVPASYSFSGLLRVLTEDGTSNETWKAALIEAYRRASNKSPSEARDRPIVPSQSARALKFSVSDGKIKLDPANPRSSEIDEHFSFFHQEVKGSINELCKDIPISTNELGELRSTLVKYLSAIGELPEDLDRPATWREGRKLRRYLSIERRKAGGVHSNAPYMSAEQLTLLEEIVALHNSLSTSDTVLSNFDRRGADPADLNLILGAQNAINVVLDTVNAPDLVESEVPETLLPMLQDDQVASSGDRARDLALGVDSTENAVLIVLKEAMKETKEAEKKSGEFKKGFLSASGKLAAGGVAAGATATATAFVVKYSTDIIAFAQKVPGGESIKTIVEWILRAVGV